MTFFRPCSLRAAAAAVVATAYLLPMMASAQQNQISFFGSGDVVLPVSSIRQSRLSGTLLQKYDFSCGSAAVATLLTHHYEYPVSERVIFDDMYHRGDQKKFSTKDFRC